MTLTLMSVSRYAKIALLGSSLGCAPLALATEEPQPDLEFLEYLGSWESSDEDWLLFGEEEDQKVVVEKSEQSDSKPIGEESTELKDES